MTVPNFDKLTVKELQVNWFKKNYPEFYQYLIDNYSDIKKFTEKLYWYVQGLTEIPKCACGNPRKFRNYVYGYNKFCSPKCSNQSESSKQKRKSTCRERYGGNAPACSQEIQDKMKFTCQERYGVSNFLKTIDQKGKVLSEETKQKMKKTCLERYGVENVMFLPEYQEKSHEKRDHTEISKKLWRTRHKKFIEEHDFLKGITEEGEWICKCPHPECNKCQERTYKVTAQMFHDRQKDFTEPCTKLLKIGQCLNKNTTIEIFIKNILDDLGIQYISNDRKILDGKELDIYIPDKNIAIECNGVFSHSSKYVASKYHYNKWKFCKEQGIQLLSIWEDWIRNKPEIVKSIIKAKLGIFDHRIGARECIIKEVPTQESTNFLEENHIQGKTNSNVKLGLYYKTELICLMTFGNKKGCSGNTKWEGWDLSRFCTKKGWQVVGGAERLLKYFKKDHKEPIISFASNDISNGNLYKKLGFREEGWSHAYWYICGNGLKRYHRSTFTKSSIKKKWNIEGDFKETEVMNDHGYYQIYDSGLTKYVLDS